MLDAEIIGASKALKAALEFLDIENYRKVGGSQQIHVFLDSQKAISELITGSSSTSPEDLCSFRALKNVAKVLVKWVPGQAGINGTKR